MTRRTKIVATIGPASDGADALEKLLRAGTDVVRLNLSHGPISEHLERLALIRKVADKVGRPVGVLADLPGPKIRAGRFPEGGVSLPAGATVELRAGQLDSDADTIWVDYETLIEDLAVGDHIVLGDGAISMQVVSVSGDSAVAEIQSGGRPQGRPGVHIPSERLRLTTPTDVDLVLAEQIAEAGVDFIAVSFVREAGDVRKVREVVGDRAELVSKIETNAALENLSEIIEESDALMVARGDLGIDCPIEDVPHLQKMVVRRCVAFGMPVIIATQMLESMTTSPSPTRAEVTDIANAVFDGTDALMLSGETAIGHDPALTVETMASIAERAESEAHYRQWATRLGAVQRESWASINDEITAALTHAASLAADDIRPAAILCCTAGGRTAKAMARFRPEAPLIALATNAKTAGQLALSWGVDSIIVESASSTDEMVRNTIETVVAEGRVARGSTVIVLAGSPSRDKQKTAADIMRIVQA